MLGHVDSLWPILCRYTFDGPDLTISNVQPDDEGVYTCQIITKLDMAEARGRLTLCGETGWTWHLIESLSERGKFTVVLVFSTLLRRSLPPFRSSGSSRLSTDKWCKAPHRQPEVDPRRRPQQRRARWSKSHAWRWLERSFSVNTCLPSFPTFNAEAILSYKDWCDSCVPKRFLWEDVQ